MAFFPCIRFENQIMLWFRGQNYGQRNWTMEEKMEYDMKLQKEVTDMYELINKLFLVCMRKNLKLIVENPYSEEHYLRRYWCLQPSVIDRDRTERGDYFKKPTQYWFVNCEPMNNIIFEPVNYNFCGAPDPIKQTAQAKKNLGMSDIKTKTFRSMIHPDYANRFIREFIIESQYL